MSGFEVDFAAGSYGAFKAALIHYAKRPQQSADRQGHPRQRGVAGQHLLRSRHLAECRARHELGTLRRETLHDVTDLVGIARADRDVGALGRKQLVKSWGRAVDVADPDALKDLYKTAMSRSIRPDVWARRRKFAAGVVFLASPVATRISGTNLIIDGALTKAV